MPYLVMYKLEGNWVKFFIKGVNMLECFEWAKANVSKGASVAIYSYPHYCR